MRDPRRDFFFRQRLEALSHLALLQHPIQPLRIHFRDRSEKPFGVFMMRRCENVVAAALLDDAAVQHDDDFSGYFLSYDFSNVCNTA